MFTTRQSFVLPVLEFFSNPFWSLVAVLAPLNWQRTFRLATTYPVSSTPFTLPPELPHPLFFIHFSPPNSCSSLSSIVLCQLFVHPFIYKFVKYLQAAGPVPCPVLRAAGNIHLLVTVP